MKSHEDSIAIFNEPKSSKRFKNDSYLCNESFNKSRIYNLEYRKRPAELVRKDLISAMKLADHEVLNRDDYFLILDSWREEWEKGVQVPVNPDALPHSTIKLITDSKNDSSFNHDHLKHPFVLSKELITHKDSSDDHHNISSYELDLQDICWLETIRESELDLDLSQNFLEYVINQFEQQWAHNIKAKQVGIEYDDHIVCDVCQSPDGEDGNEMVFCDLCNICVHQACYGIQEIPEGEWLCKPCKDLGSKKKNAICVLCPNVGGALKPTTNTNKWAHVSCIYWIPEAKFLDLNLLEPVEIKSIPNWRWNLVCSLCNVKKGAPIICDEKNCRLSYHVTCAFKHKLKMKIVLSDDKSNIRLKSYCMKHSQKTDTTNINEGKNKEIDFFASSTYENEDSNNKNMQKLNAQNEFWKYVDVNQICQEIFQNYTSGNNGKGESTNFTVTNQNFSLNQVTLNQIVDLIYQYWKLKRLSNYGNSLIKLTFAEKFQEQMKFHKNQILSLRYNLERVRTLTYMVCRREKIKQNWINTQREILETTLSFADSKELSRGSLDSEKLLSSEHKKLFSKVISHHSIYSKQKNQPRTSEFQTNQRSIEKPQHESGVIVKDKKRKSTENSIANSLIREIKRLKRSQASMNNPYARIYLNSTKSRKSIVSNENSLRKFNNDETNYNQNLIHNNSRIIPHEHVNHHIKSSKSLQSELDSNVENANHKGNRCAKFNKVKSVNKFPHSQKENGNLKSNLHKKIESTNEKVSWSKLKIENDEPSINGRGSNHYECNGLFKKLKEGIIVKGINQMTPKNTFDMYKKYSLRKKV